ncbi:MAG: ABC transporter ATP-binding protein [Coriobacteriia bacterium]|nr:ABC transporter ATP-binding protein [Coriobacteriia bacterium]
MSDTLLEFRGASIGYGSRTIVRNASFTVTPGEFVGLVGPNGAGKSTLLRAMTGGATVGEGDVRWGDVSLVRMPERERARIVGVVPQTQMASFSFTARAYVEMGRHAHLGRLASPGAADAVIVDEVMTRTDTARLADQPADELSGGDLQRLTLAQALAQQPRILLLDEPTSHLDLNHALQVLELVRSLADGGLTVLGVFHDLGLAARFADRISIVADGRVTVPAAPSDALDAQVISDVFGVRAVVRTDPVTGSIAVTPIVRDADLMPASTGPLIGLVCGSGSGAGIMRRLALSGHPLFAGALNRGDIDHAVAGAVGAGVVELPAFGEVDEMAAGGVRSGYERCACVIVCDTPFGTANLRNLEAAVMSGRPLVLIGAMDDDRDFARGAARGLWARAVDAGAVRVDSEAEVPGVLQRLAGTPPPTTTERQEDAEA